MNNQDIENFHDDVSEKIKEITKIDSIESIDINKYYCYQIATINKRSTVIDVDIDSLENNIRESLIKNGTYIKLVENDNNRQFGYSPVLIVYYLSEFKYPDSHFKQMFNITIDDIESEDPKVKIEKIYIKEAGDDKNDENNE